MTFRALILRSLRFHARSHLGVVLGAAVGSAALIGALVVGDSVRGSLRELALQRLGQIHFALDGKDRLVREQLADDLTISPRPPSDLTPNIRPLLKLSATASTMDGSTRANQVHLIGVNSDFCGLAGTSIYSNLPPDAVVFNEPLATQLRAKLGDTVLLRVRKPNGLAADAPVSPQDDAGIVLRLRLQAVASARDLGDFSLRANQIKPFNAFVQLDSLQAAVTGGRKANLLVVGPSFEFELSKSRRLLHVTEQWLDLGISRFLGPFQLQPRLRDTKATLGLLNTQLERTITLEDLQLGILLLPGNRGLELWSERIFLEQPVVDAVFSAATNPALSRLNQAFKGVGTNGLFPSRPYGVLTYLVNLIRAGDRSTPYSMVTAAEPPLVSLDLRDDEVLISEWLAEDLQIGPGATIELSYYLPDQASRLVEHTNQFRVRAVLPMDHPALDRTLMPEFPGVAEAESAGDWQTSFPLVHKIRPKDDDYWKRYRGTPKAFVTLAAGQRMWQNRFGNLTAIRFPPPGNPRDTALLIRRVFSAVQPSFLHARLPSLSEYSENRLFHPASLGFRFEPVREQALAASSQSQDFGQLFLGFSFFLILAALILMALLFQFGLEQRTGEVGTLLALGFTPKQVRRLFLGEASALALFGGVIGVAGGLGYARAMIEGLTTIWRDAVGTSALRFHVTPLTLLIGLGASVAVCVITLAMVLRKQARRPARELLEEGAELGVQSPKSKVQSLTVAAGGLSAAAGVTLILWAVVTQQNAAAGVFFGAGALFLIGGLSFASALFAALERATRRHRLSLASLGLRGCSRRRKRSLATVALLACGSFLIVAVGANRLEASRDWTKRSAGTGGFALLGESTLPVIHDLNTARGREFFGLDEKALAGVDVVPLRVRDGDEASCLNLNRAQTPRLLGVNPELLARRGAFTFAKVGNQVNPPTNAWLRLKSRPFHSGPIGNRQSAIGNPEVPALGDAASIQWALGKKIGDTLTYTDERGRPFQVRLVGGLANSILQGSLIIDEEEFLARFPSESGYRMFLIDAPSNSVSQAAATLSRALQDVGLELTPTPQRLAAFNAVQNTYLNTFQVLGGLGLLLGSAGLGVVVLRNVLERRGELALLQAVGFRRRRLEWLVLSEHGGLLWIGLGVGMVAALVAVAPVLLAPAAEIHYRALALTLTGVCLSGLAWTWLATVLALRGKLLEALRNE